jgi:hypothetical protein
VGCGVWVLGIGPNPQSPIPNPHLSFKKKFYKILKRNFYNFLMFFKFSFL